MSAAFIDQSNKVHNYDIRQRRLCVPFTITGNATPASKSTSADLSVVYVVTEGLTAAAAAVDSGTSFTTPVDSTGNFSLLLLTGTTATRKIMRASVEQRSGSTATNLFQAVALKGASSTGITTSGNIAVSVTAAGLDLSAESFDGVLVVEYMVE